MIPWFLKQPVAAAKEARMQAYREERARDLKILDGVETLPDDTAIAAFLAYVDMPPGKAADFRGAAIARMKAIPGRQQEIEDLLNQLDPRMLSALRDLDLKMTPSLCEAARKCAQNVAGKLKPSDFAPAFDSVETTFNDYSQRLAWMVDNGCDCRREIAGLEQAARLYPESFPRKWFTDHLMELQGKSREP
jgi:hypothetical protein